jgi:hypothetical protein
MLTPIDIVDDVAVAAREACHRLSAAATEKKTACHLAVGW